MKALSVEKSILEGNNEVNDLFNFVKSNTHALKAYDMEKEIFNRVMLIGLAAMKCYFAESGTGDVGTDLVIEEGKVLNRDSSLRGRDYFSIFGKIKVPRTYYRNDGQTGAILWMLW